MGMNRDRGYFTALTNVRSRFQLSPCEPTSRGILVKRFLTTAPSSFSDDERQHMALNLAGFNAIHADLFSEEVKATYLTNRKGF